MRKIDFCNLKYSSFRQLVGLIVASFVALSIGLHLEPGLKTTL